jgi:hypothetical protein
VKNGGAPPLQEPKMTDTPNLALPLLAAAQAQKHVTHNEALALLDALAQLAVSSRLAAAPPASPVEGARYLVPAGATGAFAGKAGQIALFDGGLWRFLPPKAGWLAYVADEGAALVHNGAAWVALGQAVGMIDQLSSLGVGTASDPVNRLALRAQGALMTAQRIASGGSGDMRLTVEKEAAARTGSLLFQSGYSGRAEMGLMGDDGFRVKVSADGATWRDALQVNAGTGQVSFPNGVAGLAAGGSAPAGNVRLEFSAGALRLAPCRGNGLTVNGAFAALPAGGVTLPVTGLASNTTYYIYAVAGAGLVTALEASSTAYAIHVDGTAIKAGDTTRALVGMARTVAGPAWQDSDANRLVISWFNRRPIGASARFSTIRSTASATYVEINSEIRIGFLCWADDAVQFMASGSAYNSSVATVFTSVGVDGAAPQDVFGTMSGVVSQSMALSHVRSLAEGYHYATLLGRVNGGTGFWYTNTDSAGERFTLKLVMEG